MLNTCQIACTRKIGLTMIVACFDLEGVFVPEIWIAVSKITGIKELSLTTRDISDYDELMKGRLSILDKNGIDLKLIQETIATLNPLEGAKEFLDWMRSQVQVTILSDTFYEFGMPLMKKMGLPTLFCHELEISPDGKITGYRLRQKDSKKKAVIAFQKLGFETIAVGDSYNDISMIQQADNGILFKAPDTVLKEYPDFESTNSYDELKKKISIILKSS